MKLDDTLRKTINGLLTAKPAVKKRQNHSVYRFNNGKVHHSDALGVNPAQIKEAREKLRQRGVYAEFDKEGRCLIKSERQFKDIAKASGMWAGDHGFRQLDSDGNRILTGREQVKARERLQSLVSKEARGYPGDF